MLLVRYTQTNDSGVYECQLSTDPPLRFLVTLTVVGKKFMMFKIQLFFLQYNTMIFKSIIYEYITLCIYSADPKNDRQK